jgi:hypothetical protein
MNKVKVWLIVGLVFVAGIAVGVVSTRAFVRHMVKVAVNDPDRLRNIVAKRMQRQLKLDAGQRMKVDQILEKTQNDLQDLRRDFGPRFQGIMSGAQAEISEILTLEQRERFKKFREENRHLWQNK